MNRRSIAATAIAGMLALSTATGCGEPTGEDSEPRTVQITDAGYDPKHLRIEVGDAVTFVNRAKERPHSAKDISRGDIDPSPGPGPTDHSGKDVNYATEGGFATHALFPSEPQTIVFRAARTFRYICAFADMRGVIEVVPKET